MAKSYVFIRKAIHAIYNNNKQCMANMDILSWYGLQSHSVSASSWTGDLSIVCVPHLSPVVSWDRLQPPATLCRISRDWYWRSNHLKKWYPWFCFGDIRLNHELVSFCFYFQSNWCRGPNVTSGPEQWLVIILNEIKILVLCNNLMCNMWMWMCCKDFIWHHESVFTRCQERFFKFVLYWKSHQKVTFHKIY